MQKHTVSLKVTKKQQRVDLDAPLTVFVGQLADAADAVDVAQDHVAAEPPVGAQGAFEIDLAADLQLAEGGAGEGFGHGLDGEATVSDSHRGLADAVDIDTIADGEIGEYGRGGDLQPLEFASALDAPHPPQFFYESGEHTYCTSAV